MRYVIKNVKTDGTFLLKVRGIAQRKPSHTVWRDQQRARGIFSKRKWRQRRNRQRSKLVVNNSWLRPERIWQAYKQRPRQKEVWEGTRCIQRAYFLLNSYDVKNLLFVFLRIFSSIILFCLIEFVILYLFGNKVILLRRSSSRYSFFREQIGNSFLRQHKPYHRVYLFGFICMYKNVDNYKEHNNRNDYIELLYGFLRQVCYRPDSNILQSLYKD